MAARAGAGPAPRRLRHVAQLGAGGGALGTLLFSRFYLGERPTRSEIGGALVLVLGVVLVLAGR